ncbi:MAG: head maturation protease, ClpP-related [Pseudomonadota bacterium]
MSLRDLPEIKALRLPEVCAFHVDEEAVDRWNCEVKASQTTDNTITILDSIGEDWFGEGVTSKRIASALRRIGDGEVHVDINSPGGDFFEGVAIYNLLRQHRGKVTVRILGLAASAASVIAMAGDEVLIAKSGFLMIHNAWVLAIGNRHDLMAAAEQMKPFDEAMAGVYADRSRLDQPTVAEHMDNETFFSGEEAISIGLADGLLESDELTTQARAKPSGTAARRVDTLLAKAGMPRSERRALLGELKSGMQDAAVDDTQDAAVAEALMGLSAILKQ